MTTSENAQHDCNSIRLNRFSLSFAGKPILKDISFEIKQGQTLAIIGESGSGKTSLARMLLGLIDGTRDDPALRAGKPHSGFHYSGQAWVGGLDLVQATDSQLRRFRGKRIGLIMQALSDALNPHMTVLAHVREVINVHGLTGMDARATCLEYNIPEHLHGRHPRDLSGGEIQRLLTCLALLNNPAFLILDEPTASLDPINKDRAVQFFLSGRETRCQILITHHLQLARRLADHVGTFHRGEMIEYGPPQEVLENPRQAYTKMLLQFEASLSPHRNKTSHADEARQAAACVIRNDHRKDQAGLEIANLSHAFGDTPLLSDVSAFVPTGNCLAIQGPSGCGKTTFARLLTGLEPIQSGTVTWRPARANGAGVASQAPVASLISQHPHRAMARHFSVEKVLREAIRLTSRQGRKPDSKRVPSPTEPQIRKRILSLLEQVGLPGDDDFLKRKSAALSGGEAQRLVIARALASNPHYLVADEPTSALDIATCAQILSVLRDVMRDRGVGLILFTHDRAVAQSLSHQLLVLDRGRLTTGGQGV